MGRGMRRALLSAVALVFLAASRAAPAPSLTPLPPGSSEDGTAEHPYRLDHLKIAHMVTRDEAAEQYPQSALRNDTPGRARVVCRITATGDLTDCVVKEEEPDGLGFGAATIALTQHIKLIPGIYSPTTMVEVPMRWQVADMMPVGWKKVTTETSRIWLSEYAYCAVHRHWSMVQQALALPPLLPSTGQRMLATVGDECWNNSGLTASNGVLRGALFAALYQHDYEHAKLDVSLPVDYSRDVGTETSGARNYIALHLFADCVVRQSPEDSRELVLSPPAGPAEAAAFAKLGPRFSACLTKGQNLRFSPPVLSGLIAEALYRHERASGLR